LHSSGWTCLPAYLNVDMDVDVDVDVEWRLVSLSLSQLSAGAYLAHRMVSLYTGAL
jgi:hypothetical protein